MTITLYGIPNCDTVKKARGWLEVQELLYHFHDYRRDGVDRDKLAHWVRVLGLDQVLNRAGTTFRKLPEADKADLDDAKALDLMVAHPAMIRRPILEYPDGLIAGFKPAEWERLLIGE